MGIVVYCSFPEKEEPYSKVWERNLSLWYKAYKKRKQEEGGGSFLIASVPHLPKNSPELERLRQEIGFEILFPGEQLLSDSKQTSDKKESTDVSKTETKSAATASEKPTKRRKNKKGGKSTKKAVKESGERPDASSKQARRQTTGKREKIKPDKSQIILPATFVQKSAVGLNFLFYSPSLTSLKSSGTPSWKEEFQSQLSLWKRDLAVHFLLMQDPNPTSAETSNPITEEIQFLRPILLGDLPAVTLLSYSRSLRFFDGEYSFGCGANPNSLKITVLELFFRNGKMIRISEESYSLNSADSNKSWILESN